MLNKKGQQEENAAERDCWCYWPISQWSADIEIDQMIDGGHSTHEVWTGKATAMRPRHGDCSAINTHMSSDILTPSSMPPNTCNLFNSTLPISIPCSRNKHDLLCIFNTGSLISDSDMTHKISISILQPLNFYNWIQIFLMAVKRGLKFSWKTQILENTPKQHDLNSDCSEASNLITGLHNSNTKGNCIS